MLHVCLKICRRVWLTLTTLPLKRNWFCPVDHCCSLIIQARTFMCCVTISAPGARAVIFLKIQPTQFTYGNGFHTSIKFNQNRQSWCSIKWQFYFWGSFEWPLFFEQEFSHSPGTEWNTDLYNYLLNTFIWLLEWNSAPNLWLVGAPSHLSARTWLISWYRCGKSSRQFHGIIQRDWGKSIYRPTR
jgi:hypothetical protein